MTRTSQRVLVGALAVAAAACAEPATGPTASNSLLSDAFTTLPVGYSSVTSSFASGGDAGLA